MQQENDKMRDFGSRIKEALLMKKLKNKDLAAKIGVSENYLSAVINGRKRTKKVDLLTKIAAELGVSLPWLLGEDDYLGDIRARWRGELDKDPETIRRIKDEIRNEVWLELDRLMELLSDGSIREINGIVKEISGWENLYGPVKNEVSRRWDQIMEKNN